MLPELFNYLQKSLDSHLLLYEKASLVYMKAVYDLKVDFTNAKAKENLSSCVSTFELLECFELVNSIKKEVNDYFPNYHI